MAVLAIALTIGLLVWKLGASPTARDCRCSKQTFDGVVSLPGVTVSVEKVDSVEEGGTYGDPNDKGYPQTIDLLPKLCAVTIKVTNTSETPDRPQSDYRFGMFLPPSQKWNSRILSIGSGSFAGGINWPYMSEGPHYGFATISTDNGHNSIPSDLSWATNATLYDWGYRALHGSIVVGKLLISTYYNKDFTYSYYAGCSTGGRQGLREIQYDANAFDGALIGAPAWDTNRLMPWVSKMAYEMLTSGNDILSLQQFQVIAAEVVRQCDPVDGNKDNVVTSPELCDFDISRIVCNNPTRCVTQGQAELAMKFYDDYNTAAGKFVSHGFGLTSEDQWAVYFGDRATLEQFDFSFEREWVYNDSNWDWRNFGDQVVTDTALVNPGDAAADNYDISSYRDRAPAKKSGKILMYHGLADGLISPKSSLQYYDETKKATNSDDDGLREWFRFFEVPGMQHCWFSNRQNAPWHFAGSGQATQLRLLPNLGLPAAGDGWSVAGHLGDPEYDALAALVRWVEEDHPVDHIIATAYSADYTVNRTRPLCPYPQKAIYNKRGNINQASSWSCGIA